MDVTRSDFKSMPFRMTRESRALLARWLGDRVLPEIFLDNLPKAGLMVFHQNTPVGVVFLRMVEGGKGMLDGFLADPSIPHKVRKLALDQLIADVVKLACDSELTGVFGLTTNKRVVERAKNHGFSVLDHKLVSMRLNASPWGVQ